MKVKDEASRVMAAIEDLLEKEDYDAINPLTATLSQDVIKEIGAHKLADILQDSLGRKIRKAKGEPQSTSTWLRP